MHALRDQPIQSNGVALTANRRVMANCLLSAGNPMRVMAGFARQRVPAGDKASRLAKPVGGAADDFKLVVASRAERMVKGQQESAQRLSGTKGKRPSIEPPDQGRNR